MKNIGSHIKHFVNSAIEKSIEEAEIKRNIEIEKLSKLDEKQLIIELMIMMREWTYQFNSLENKVDQLSCQLNNIETIVRNIEMENY